MKEATVDRETKRAEALDRMRKIGLFPEIIRQFEDEGKVNATEGPLGACYELTPEQAERVRDFEENNAALVFHVIVNAANYPWSITDEAGNKLAGGATDNFIFENYLYVSDYEEEWEMDREDLDGGQCLAYVYNVTAPDLSEIGAIGVKLSGAGGLLRTW